MTTPVNFTKAYLDSLELPVKGKRLTYFDAKTRGLLLRTTFNGVKTFSVNRRVKGGRLQRVTLGRYPELSIEQARRQASKVNAAIEDGANPAEAKRAHKSAPTFDEVFALYMERHARKMKRTADEDQRQFDQYLKLPLGNIKATSIDRQAITTLHSKITGEGHPTQANRVLSLVSSVYGKAMSWPDCHVSHNPATGIKRNREVSRERFLSRDEMPRFFDALAEEPNSIMRDYFWVSLLTGVRRGNLLAMRWAELNLDDAAWRIPRTKNETPQLVHLTPPVVERLRTRQNDSSRDATFVFPGDGETGHLTSPKSGWRRLLKKSELHDVRPHDLRRCSKTLASWINTRQDRLKIDPRDMTSRWRFRMGK